MLSRPHKAAFIVALLDIEKSNKPVLDILELWLDRKMKLEDFIEDCVKSLSNPSESWKIQQKSVNKSFPQDGFEKLCKELEIQIKPQLKKYLPQDSELVKGL